MTYSNKCGWALLTLLTLTPFTALAQAQATPKQQPQPKRGATPVAAPAQRNDTEAAILKTTDDIFLCHGNPGNYSELPILKIEQILDTGKKRLKTDVTLVTQLSFERLYMLEGQCDVWSGIISAAVYIAVVNGKAITVELNSNQDPKLVSMDVIRHKFKKFHELAEAKSLCKLDLQLVSQSVESVWLSALYPVNAMRNRAIANARTDIIFLLDVDFWPSAELSQLMQVEGKYNSLLETVNAGGAVVLPAYETGDSGEIGVEVAREAVLTGKDAAITMFWDGRLKPFHTDRYKPGHRSTDYGKWLGAVNPYRIQYEEGYEPYVMIARKYVPWTDERFVGYRKNKVVHLLHLANLGLEFMVHPRAFVVHSPHPRARTWKVTHKTGLWDQLAELYTEVRTKLEADTYLPSSMYSCYSHVVGPAIQNVTHISEIREGAR